MNGPERWEQAENVQDFGAEGWGGPKAGMEVREIKRQRQHLQKEPRAALCTTLQHFTKTSTALLKEGEAPPAPHSELPRAESSANSDQP